MALDILFCSLSSTIRSPDDPYNPVSLSSLAASDSSEAQLLSAKQFLESVYGDPYAERGRASRAQTPMVASRSQTPMTVWDPFIHFHFLLNTCLVCTNNLLFLSNCPFWNSLRITRRLAELTSGKILRNRYLCRASNAAIRHLDLAPCHNCLMLASCAQCTQQ